MFTAIQVQAGENIQSLIIATGGLIGNLVNIALALSLLVFLWGLTVFILNSGNESKLEDGKRLMIWGIIALFVMASIWGIIAFLQDTSGIESNPIIGFNTVSNNRVSFPHLL